MHVFPLTTFFYILLIDDCTIRITTLVMLVYALDHLVSHANLFSIYILMLSTRLNLQLKMNLPWDGRDLKRTSVASYI
jgi:hypothetical protein